MQLFTVLLSSIACLALAAPQPLGPGTLAYFNFLGQRFQMLQEKIPKKSENQAPIASCNNFALSTAQFPSLPSGLPAPSGTPYHVAIGRGSQVRTHQSTPPIARWTEQLTLARTILAQRTVQTPLPFQSRLAPLQASSTSHAEQP